MNKKIIHASLFSGIGGFDLAAEWMEWENRFQCEINTFCQQILKYYWPNSKLYGDIKTTDFTIWRDKIDILTGGFPCQPYSTAGKRLGKADDRHLWPEMLRAIREIQPRYIVGENVNGLISWNGGLVFDEVQTDMENEGYEVWPFILPASGKNAPHQRSRVWFIAHALRNGFDIAKEFEKRFKNKGKWISRHDIESFFRIRNASNANKFNDNISGFRTGKISQFKASGIFENNVTYSEKQRLERSNTEKTFTKRQFMQYDFRKFPTQSPFCSRNDGISTQLDGITFSKWRNESIKGYGNAIVPQVAYEIFKVIDIIENATI